VTKTKTAGAWRAHERIAAAACKVEGMTCSMPPPHRHHDVMKAIWHMNRRLGAVPPENQGFITNTGRFVGREEACVIARAAGQILEKTPPGNKLFSEDLW